MTDDIHTLKRHSGPKFESEATKSSGIVAHIQYENHHPDF